MTCKQITKDDVAWRIECFDEDMPVRGNFIVSGDDEQDKKDEDEILEKLSWNPWAWCCVRVSGAYMGLTADDYVGGCSYDDEEQFISESGYFEYMRDTVLKEIQDQVNAIVEKHSHDAEYALLVR